jgi:SAM-dependent methyltransferase
VRRCLQCDTTFAETWTCPACGFAPQANGHLRFAPELAGAPGFQEASFDVLEKIEGESFWFRSRNELIAWALRRYFGDARSFFELGCGTGYVLAHLRGTFRGLHLVGGEAYDAGIDVAKRRLAGVDLVQLDGRALPYVDEFDVSGCFDVLEHIDEDEAVLAQLRNATRAGGGLLITVPQHPALWTSLDEVGFHKRRYTRHELESKLRRTGWRLLRMTSFVSLLLPVLLVSRLRNRDREIDPLAEFGLPRVVDRALERTMGMERALIRRGIDFPAGGSLLAVATR